MLEGSFFDGSDGIGAYIPNTTRPHCQNRSPKYRRDERNDNFQFVEARGDKGFKRDSMGVVAAVLVLTLLVAQNRCTPLQEADSMTATSKRVLT